MSEPNNRQPNNLGPMIVGVIVFVATLTCWLVAEMNGISTGPILGFAVPVVGALFIGNNISAARSAAEQAANQTNGSLEARVKAGTAAALADRDAARTRQTRGDISADTETEATR